jgi:hypothetical protein
LGGRANAPSCQLSPGVHAYIPWPRRPAWTCWTNFANYFSVVFVIVRRRFLRKKKLKKLRRKSENLRILCINKCIFFCFYHSLPDSLIISRSPKLMKEVLLSQSGLTHSFFPFNTFTCYRVAFGRMKRWRSTPNVRNVLQRCYHVRHVWCGPSPRLFGILWEMRGVWRVLFIRFGREIVLLSERHKHIDENWKTYWITSRHTFLRAAWTLPIARERLQLRCATLQLRYATLRVWCEPGLKWRR